MNGFYQADEVLAFFQCSDRQDVFSRQLKNTTYAQQFFFRHGLPVQSVTSLIHHADTALLYSEELHIIALGLLGDGNNTISTTAGRFVAADERAAIGSAV